MKLPAAAGKKKSETTSNAVTSIETKTAAAESKPPQASLFEKAMEHFHGRNFREAIQLFADASSGPSLEIARAARLHVRMCEQRLDERQYLPKSSDDHYNFAVALINHRDLPQARSHLEAALEMTPQAGHLHYAMALLSGLEGDYAASARFLARAIELEPANRSAARNDADFHDILRRPELRAVLDRLGAHTV